ncbi:MAG: energy transducer TonB [Bacteroidaceae bacterium]|nr:energy transducer TonB [Bacteroidaceae bacterium]
MEAKRTANEVLHDQSTLCFFMGLVIVLAAHFVCFEWTWFEYKAPVEEGPVLVIAPEEDMIPITRQEQPVAPPPAAAPTVEEVIEIVDDEVELNKEEIDTSEELNQSVTAIRGDGGTVAVAPSAPPAPVEDVEEDRIFDIVEEAPSFPGGDAACMKWLSDHIKYPASCVEQGIQGRVMASFVVNKDGSIVDVKVLRSPDPALSKEAERVLMSMPKWKPGKQRGKPVRVKFTLPVMFRLT